MALPMILSLLGSGLAGASALGTLSPLIAGAAGAGLGTAIEEEDLGAGLRAGLTAGLLGGALGSFAGGAGAATAQGGATAGSLGANATGSLGTGAPGLFGDAAAREAAAAGATGIRGGLAQMPSGFQSVVTRPDTISGMFQQGVNQGVLTGAGIGTAIPGTLRAMQPQPFEVPEEEYIPEAEPFERRQLRPGAGYRPGYDPEFIYFSPTNYGSRYFAQGGMIRYQPVGMAQPRYMQAGGIADAMPGAERMPMMNDKDIVQESIRAIKGQLPEEEAAVVLGMFLEQYGEEALRRLVTDVKTGKADGERGDVEGMVEGPGDGMDDFVPAAMDDGSQDVLLSDGEFVVPADVVSGLGNGSTDAGAEELYDMMDRVREERTGMTEQPDQIKVGGLLPA